MKEMNLCIDIDGTVTEPYYWLQSANRFFNTNVREKDVTDYEIHRVLGIQRKAYDAFYDAQGQELHRQAAIREGAKDVLHRLSAHHRIHFVTAREQKMKDVSLEWLERHELPMNTLSLLGTYDKTAEAKRLDCGLFIEDSLQNARILSEAGFDVLLLNCGYNTGVLPSNIVRVDNWHQIEKVLQDIS